MLNVVVVANTDVVVLDVPVALLVAYAVSNAVVVLNVVVVANTDVVVLDVPVALLVA